MSTELVTMPEAWTYGTGYRYGSYNSTDVATPYADLGYVQQVMRDRAVEMPFQRIVTACDGFSTCKRCGARYAGRTDQCNALTWKHKIGGSYHYEHGFPPNSTYYRIADVKLTECGSGEVTWDLAEEFYQQQDFFRFVGWLGTLPKRQGGWLSKYSHLLPPGAAEEYRILAIEKGVAESGEGVSQLKSATSVIADKMNAAGAALHFGFR